MTSTLASFEIRLSTSVSCFDGEFWASAEIYFTPALSRTALIAASRSSWKFDHDTPTVRSFAITAIDVRLADASSAAQHQRFCKFHSISST